MDMEQHLVITNCGNGTLYQTPVITAIGILCQHHLTRRRRNRGGRCQRSCAEQSDAVSSETQGDALYDGMHDFVLPPREDGRSVTTRETDHVSIAFLVSAIA